MAKPKLTDLAFEWKDGDESKAKQPDRAQFQTVNSYLEDRPTAFRQLELAGLDCRRHFRE